jgi:hypothetical protein
MACGFIPYSATFGAGNTWMSDNFFDAGLWVEYKTNLGQPIKVNRTTRRIWKA